MSVRDFNEIRCREANLPTETNTTAVAQVVSKNLAGQDVVAKEDGGKFLHGTDQPGRQSYTRRKTLYHLSKGLGQVRHIQISRIGVAFGLQARVERLLPEVSTAR